MNDPTDAPAASERESERRTAGSERPDSDHERPETSPARNGVMGTDLRLAVVEYEGRPDRGTIHPPEVTGIDRMETWISVDMGIVVDVAAWR